MSVVAVIPARGGSKGVPRKNLREVGGRSLLARAITACRDARGIDRIIVSTDDEEIAAAARSAGAEIPFMRPAMLALGRRRGDGSGGNFLLATCSG